jgi:hypothetical protein
MNTADSAAPSETTVEEKKIPTRSHGQHTFFVVKGPNSEAAYDAAAAMGLKVLDVVRLRATVPAIRVEKDVEVETQDPAFPDDATKKIKTVKKVQVLAEMQPAVYRRLGDSKGDLERRAKSHSGMEDFVETEFTYVVKAMGDPSETLE